jgi:hypothetical protein
VCKSFTAFQAAMLLNTAVVGLICFAMTDARLITAHLTTERMVTPAVCNRPAKAS